MRRNSSKDTDRKKNYSLGQSSKRLPNSDVSYEGLVVVQDN